MVDAAGVELFTLARFMGTSIEQLDRTYGHLMPDAIERTRTGLDTFDSHSMSALSGSSSGASSSPRG